MDLMQEHDDDLNRKVILLSVGSAAAAALLIALARHKQDQGEASRVDEVSARAEDVVADVKRGSKKAAKGAKKKRKTMAAGATAAGHRVVDDATHLASWFGTEARNLAGEGKEKIAQLRHRDEGESTVEREVERLRAEIEELKEQLGKAGRRADKDVLGLAAWFAGKSGPTADVVASEATAAALGQIERALRAKAPAL